MPIISVRDNKGNTYNWKGKQTKTERNEVVTQAIVGMWELNDFLGL